MKKEHKAQGMVSRKCPIISSIVTTEEAVDLSFQRPLLMTKRVHQL